MIASKVVILWKGWKLFQVQERSCSVASWERDRLVEHQNDKYQNLTDGPSPSSCSPHAVQAGWDMLLDWRGSSSFAVWNCSSIWFRERVNMGHSHINTEQESPGSAVVWVTTTVTPRLELSYNTQMSAWQNNHLQFLFLLAWMYLKWSWRHPAVLRWKYLWTDNEDLGPQQRGE